MINSNTIEERSPKLVACPSFSIPKYMLFLVLPKCVMVHGESISSVYFQMAVNVNHKKNSKKWQQKKCWIHRTTISKIIGYNVRTVDKATQTLIDLELIEKSNHGKLKMFELKNDAFTSGTDIYNFVMSIEKALLKDLPQDKSDFLTKQFNLLNSKMNFLSPLHAQQFVKKAWFQNINELRQHLTKAESVYKGSSLFFMNLILQDIFKKRNAKTKDTISEVDRSLFIGCSQPTLNRYMLAYEKENMIKRVRGNASYPIEIKINVKTINNSDNDLYEGVVNTMENKDLVCPICNKDDFTTQRALSMHLTKSKEEQHMLLNELKKNYEFGTSLSTIYNENLDKFGNSIPQVKEVKLKDGYMSIPCECKMSCHDCFKNWKSDFFDGCSHLRKSAYIEEYGLKTKQQKPKEKPVKEVKPKQEETGFENIPSVKKGPSPDTAPGLLKYFYEMTGGTSPNWSKEGRQIKILLEKNKLTPDQIRVVLSHMVRKSHTDLRFLSTSINDALLEQKLIQETEQEGTASYLVKRFYNGHGLQVNLQTLIKDVQKIQETINSGLSYEDTKKVIDYMVSTKCTVLNFIGSKRNEALVNQGESAAPRQLVKTASKNTNNFKSNPSFFDQDDLTILRDELRGGRTHLKKVKVEQLEKAVEIAKQILVEKSFNSRFTSFEWTWKIGLELDENIYMFACQDLGKPTYFDHIFANSSKIKPEQLEVFKQLRTSFENWLEKQHQIFGKHIQNS